MIRIAVVGLFVAAILAGIALAQEDKPADQPKAEQPSEAKEQPAPKLPMAPPDRPESIKTNWAKPLCDNPQTHEEADLCEQRRMAKAAEWAIGVGVLTLVGVALTVHFARKAANAAIEAAKHGNTAAVATVDAAGAAQTSAAAASRQVSIMEDTAERQLRAYVSVEQNVKPILKIGAIPEARLAIKNSGQTPAYDVWQWVAGKVMDAGAAQWTDMPGLPEGKEGEFGSRSTLPAAGGIGIRGHEGVPLTDEQFASIMDDKLRFFVWGEVHYVDAFGKHRVTKYRMDIGGETIRLNATTMRHCEKGNEAT